MPPPTDELDHVTPTATHAVATTLGWGLAAACVAGNVWAILGSVLEHQRLIDLLSPGLFIRSDLLDLLGVLGAGAGVGFILASFVALLRGVRGTIVLDAGWWGAATGVGLVATTLAYPHVVVAAGSHLPPLLGSTLCFAAWGFAVGSCGYIWSRRIAARPIDREPDPDGASAEEPTAGTAWVPEEHHPRPPLTVHARSALRLLPLAVVAAGSLVAAAVVAPSQAALALAAVGLLGIAVIPVLWSQEARLGALERRTHSPKGD